MLIEIKNSCIVIYLRKTNKLNFTQNHMYQRVAKWLWCFHWWPRGNINEFLKLAGARWTLILKKTQIGRNIIRRVILLPTDLLIISVLWKDI